MSKFTAEQLEHLEELIEFIEVDKFNIKGSVKGSVLGSVGGDVKGTVKGSVGGDVKGHVCNVAVRENPLHKKNATENPCEELWYKNRVKELEYLLEKAYANLHKLDPDGTLRGYDDD